MHYQAPRRVAIINSRRIPFCRANTAYTHQSNQDMMTATLQSPSSSARLLQPDFFSPIFSARRLQL